MNGAELLAERYAHLELLIEHATRLQDGARLDLLEVIDHGPTVLRAGTGEFLRLLDPGWAIASRLPERAVLAPLQEDACN